MKAVLKQITLPAAMALATLVALAPLARSKAGNAPIVGRVQIGSAGLASAVVYLEGVRGPFAPPTQRITIDQANKTFIPHVVAAMKGSNIELVNSDDFLHNTFSDSKAKAFNFNQPQKGSRSLLKVDQAGVIEVHCHIHGSMQAWIVVVDNPYFAVTDQRGIFKIDGVPPGTYKLKSWSEQHGILTQEVKVIDKEGAKVIIKYAGK